MNYQEQQKMRERMTALEKLIKQLLDQFKVIEDRLLALEAPKVVRKDPSRRAIL